MDNKIIDEVRKVREKIARESGFDSHKIFMWAQERQTKRKTVNLQAGKECPAQPSTSQQVAESVLEWAERQVGEDQC